MVYYHFKLKINIILGLLGDQFIIIILIINILIPYRSFLSINKDRRLDLKINLYFLHFAK